MGLLQEAVLAARVKPNIHDHLCPGQSGYMRDVEDPMLVLFELVMAQAHMGRLLWLCFGDFVKAFPRTCRADLLSMLYSGPGIRNGAFALLDDIMSWDELFVWLSGSSSTVIRNGLPEGGSLGSLCYTTLPDSLVRRLARDGFGIGLNFDMPGAWRGHVWCCRGTPCPKLVAYLVDALKNEHALPQVSLLRCWPTMEASAARALDLCAVDRVAILFHADDPVILASSAGELQRTLNAIASWADEHNARFHAGPSKTVIMTVPYECTSPPQFHMNAHSGVSEQLLCYKNVHRWLGVLWPHDLCFTAALLQAIGCATRACAPLIALVSAKAVPLSFAVELFEAKVDSVLNVGRWLYVLVPAAQSALDEALERWARALLGAEPWRSSAVARSELGWQLSGFARAVRSLALRRARLWARDTNDWYRSYFMHCHVRGLGWASSSLRILSSWGVADWPSVQDTCPTHASYVRLVQSSLTAACSSSLQAGLDAHGGQVPYTCFQACPSDLLSLSRRCDLPWSVQVKMRGWCRMRAGLPGLRSLHGRRSNARFQRCIFCEGGVRNATVHSLAVCGAWIDYRRAFVVASMSGESLSAHQLTVAILGVHPGSPGFSEAVILCDAVDARATGFWKEREFREIAGSA